MISFKNEIDELGLNVVKFMYQHTHFGDDTTHNLKIWRLARRGTEEVMEIVSSIKLSIKERGEDAINGI